MRRATTPGSAPRLPTSSATAAPIPELAPVITTTASRMASDRSRLAIRPYAAEGAVERRDDPITSELALFAQELHDGVPIGLKGVDVERARDLGLKIELADLLDEIGSADAVPDGGRHVLDAAMLLHQLVSP